MNTDILLRPKNTLTHYIFECHVCALCYNIDLLFMVLRFTLQGYKHLDHLCIISIFRLDSSCFLVPVFEKSENKMLNSFAFHFDFHLFSSVLTKNR